MAVGEQAALDGLRRREREQREEMLRELHAMRNQIEHQDTLMDEYTQRIATLTEMLEMHSGRLTIYKDIILDLMEKAGIRETFEEYVAAMLAMYALAGED